MQQQFNKWLQGGHLQDADLSVALNAAFAGTQAVQTTAPTDVSSKGNFADLVCATDIAADKAIHAVISSCFPFDAVLSEELAPENNARSARLWIVDPLDATTALLFGARRMVSTMIALMRNGKLEVAVIAFPFTDDWWYAVRGEGAWHNGVRIRCQSPASLTNEWVDLNQYGDSKLETAAFTRLDHKLRSCCRLVTRQVPHSGVVCSVIGGQIAAAVHDNHPKKLKQAVWDLAPQILLAEEAGGLVVDSRGNNLREALEQQQWEKGRIVGIHGYIVIAGSKQLALQMLDARSSLTCSNIVVTMCVAAVTAGVYVLSQKCRSSSRFV